MGETTDSPKARLRGALDARRTAVAAEALGQASLAICERIAASVEYARCRHVVLYAARRGEVELGAIDGLVGRDAGRTTYYPRVEGGRLAFRRATRDQLVPGRFGIPEPAASAPSLPRDAGDVLVVVPGLAFDRRGNRLGTGKGYYDRALPEYPHATRIGVALEVCMVDRIPVEQWDVPMHLVVTERDSYVVDVRVDAHPGDLPWR